MTPYPDLQYSRPPEPGLGIDHAYGSRVCLHSYSYPMTLLARMADPETRQPMVNLLVARMYDFLLGKVANIELAVEAAQVPTRMISMNPEGVYQGAILTPSQEIIVVDVARAGILPANVIFDGLNLLLGPGPVRQDHVFMNRKVNQAGEVVGVDLHGSKIGGPVDGRLVIIPDPMGATGSSLAQVVELYTSRPEGLPVRFIAVNLVTTPEYLRRALELPVDLRVHAIRLDRGLSSPEVLQTRPGERWEDERGLNDADYIVPGAGGIGELMNNALY